MKGLFDKVLKWSIVGLVVASLLLGAWVIYRLYDSKTTSLGTVTTHGIFIRDTIEIRSFQDPTIQGVTCYITFAKRTMSLQDPTDSSIACTKTGKIVGELKDESSLITEGKNLFFKTLVVDRFYDKDAGNLVYISYTKNVKGSNHSHSVSTVHIN